MEVETQSARRVRRPAAAGEPETSNSEPTRVDVRPEASSDAGSTPAASTISRRASPVWLLRCPTPLPWGTAPVHSEMPLRRAPQPARASSDDHLLVVTPDAGNCISGSALLCTPSVRPTSRSRPVYPRGGSQPPTPNRGPARRCRAEREVLGGQRKRSSSRRSSAGCDGGRVPPVTTSRLSSQTHCTACTRCLVHVPPIDHPGRLSPDLALADAW